MTLRDWVVLIWKNRQIDKKIMNCVLELSTTLRRRDIQP